MKLFSLEKYSKALFDPLYVADMDPFEEYAKCKSRCGRTEFECFNKCSEELQKRLDNEVKHSLKPEHQDIFNKKFNELSLYTECMTAAETSQRSINKCMIEHSQNKHAINSASAAVTMAAPQ